MDQRNEIHRIQTALLPFDPIVLILDVAKRWLLIVLVMVIVGVGTFFVADTTYTPVYKSTVVFVVSDRNSNASVYSNLSSTTGLASVFSELLSSSILRETILEEIGDTTFNGTIHTAVIPETNLLSMTVSSSNPRTAFLVAQAVIDYHHTLTYQVVDGVTLEVLQNPTVPLAPANPADHLKSMHAAMLSAAVASFVLLFLFAYAKNAIRSGTEARKKLDCDYLGEIPHEQKHKTLFSKVHLQKTGILINNPSTSLHFTESIRKLRHRIAQHMHGGKVLMVTSLLENEGKSTISVNLALAMAQKHSKVLLIDCDLQKPACHLLMGRKDVTHGLYSVLNENAKLSDAIVQDKKNNLYMLLEPCGKSDPGALFSSEMMRALLKWACREFDFVVLDLPPMSVAPTAERIMELSDASLLVVRQNAASASALNKAIATLEDGKAKLLGCVLNNVYTTPLPFSQDYGYSYDGYGKYGRYGTYQSKK